MGELLKDVDDLVKRLERVDGALSQKVAKAMQHAAASAYSSTKSGIEAVMDEQKEKLEEAGKYGAALIGNQLNSKSALIATTADHAKRGRMRFVAVIFGVALAASVLGGFIGTRMALL
ncbi:hypothetical protein [Variovorax sp. YR216]|uniref:hypothetical protein n=1 Tax=Variovorax sp. YR216 TaxID=1882828 RepID=UPI001160061B|nr:hypothetical protein [Variovorax sp. YR216]